MNAKTKFRDPACTEMLEALGQLGARYDAAPLFPAESLAIVAKAGLHRRFAPQEARGERFSSNEARNAAMLAALVEVGAGDPSVGRLYEGHVNALLLFEWYGSREQKQWLRTEIEKQAWFGVWASEPVPGVRIEHGAQSRLTGAKCFASGAGGIDWALATASRDEEPRRLVIIRANNPERADLSAWRVRGMRASVSGTYDCAGIEVTEDSLLGHPGDYDREPRFTAGAWRFCAVQLGGIEALIEEMALRMSHKARADAVLRQRFAKAHIAARSARFWVEEAAQKAAGEASDAITVSRIARGVVEDAGLLAIETAARVLGTRSAFDGERADKLARDLSLYLRQAGPDHARDEAAKEILASQFGQLGDIP